MAIGKKLYHLALAAGGGGMLTYGWDAGVLGGVLLTPQFQSAMGMPDTNTVAMIASVFLLASWLGCMIMAAYGMVLGRRQNILLGNLITAVGTIICATSYGPIQMIASRVIVGIGNGILTSMVPLYAAEMAVDKFQRGRGVNAMIAIANMGTALAYWVDFGMIFGSTSAVWRFPISFQIVWSALSSALIWGLPDTPRWYYAKGRIDEGDVVLSNLIVMNSSAKFDEWVQTKKEILASLEVERAEVEGLKFSHFFWDTSDTQAARRIRTGMILFSLCYLQGIDFIFYYMTSVFEVYIGLPSLTSSGLSGAATTLVTIVCCIGLICIEKMSRRTWLVGGACIQSIAMCVLTGLLAHPGKQTGAAAAAMIFLWLVASAPAWGPMTYVYASEIMPLRYRHIGFSLSVSCQWLMAWLTVYACPIAASNPSVGWKIWILFLVFNILSVPFVYFCCPETRGLSLEEIDLIFLKQGSNIAANAVKTLKHEDPGHSNSLSAMEEGTGASATETPKHENPARTYSLSQMEEGTVAETIKPKVPGYRDCVTVDYPCPCGGDPRSHGPESDWPNFALGKPLLTRRATK